MIKWDTKNYGHLEKEKNLHLLEKNKTFLHITM